MPTILVVDDSAVDRTIVSGLLERKPSWSTTSCADGREAIEHLKRSPLPDVIVTDLQMPEMDGLQLVEAVKEEYPNIPVILLTAKGSEQIAVDALRLGAASYVPKRRLGDDLVDMVSRILASVAADRTHQRLLHYLSCSEQVFDLRNDFEQIAQLARHIQQQLRCLPLGDETERLRVSLALEEALKNACLHGNLEIETPPPGADPAELQRLLRQRASQAPYSRRILHIKSRIDRDVAEFVIRDEGPGFDHSQMLKQAVLNDQDEVSTRGLALMRTIFDDVHFNETGNEVTLTKRAVTLDEDDLIPDDDETIPIKDG